MEEQREKYQVHALRKARIWDLIVEAKIPVISRSKTPVYSLSSQLTEGDELTHICILILFWLDVRRRGNESRVLRVATGLYALRKGMDKLQLALYLRDNYPDLEEEWFPSFG